MRASISHSVAMRERRSANRTDTDKDKQQQGRVSGGVGLRRGEETRALEGCLIEGMRDGTMHLEVC